jgi:hypothetical protein
MMSFCDVFALIGSDRCQMMTLVPFVGFWTLMTVMNSSRTDGGDGPSDSSTTSTSYVWLLGLF